MDMEPGRLQSMGSQRVRHNLTEHMLALSKSPSFFEPEFIQL